MDNSESQAILLETPANDVFIAPSVNADKINKGVSYTYHSQIPSLVEDDKTVECVLGVDEAGRGPVLGPMVYGLLYLPLAEHRSLLADIHHFDDSKVLTPENRSALLKTLCTPETDLFGRCGWATRLMSAQDISAGMLKPSGTYNLNAQAMDATIELIKQVFEMGINVKEIYIDTIGPPAVYQKRLEKVFPTTSITVAKKADSLYPCVSAASVCAKVTRDAALGVNYKYCSSSIQSPAAEGWGSGYPGDGRSTSWMKMNMDPFFGWGNECRFSWSTAKDLLETEPLASKTVEWAVTDEEHASKVTDFFSCTADDPVGGTDEIANWFGACASEAVL